MPWTGQDITEQREQFVVRATHRNQPFKEICGLFGISRRTGYKWVNRYQEVGNLRDLKERSRRPHQVPNKTTPDIESNVLALRDHVGWGARRLVRDQCSSGNGMAEANTPSGSNRRFNDLSRAPLLP